jgi:hypothetical protein
MLELFVSMAKEEWRMHASLFGGRMFALFPVVLALFTFGFCLFIPLFSPLFTVRDIYLFLMLACLLFGLSVGAFALMGREAMNRRFGHASMVAFSSRTLPVSERRIFFNVIANDVLFYTFFYLLPFFIGFSGAAVVTGAVPAFQPHLLSSIILSFICGLSISFFLSTLYVRLGKAFVGVALLCAAAFALGGFALDADMALLFPPASFFFTSSSSSLALSFVLIFLPSAISLAFVKIEFSEKERFVKSSIGSLSEKFGKMFSAPHLVAKDMLDLQRSEGGIGKVFFSFLIPLAMIWAMLYIFSGLFILPEGATFLIFCVLVGALSSTSYNWLTEYDEFSSYSFLPVAVSDVMKSKLKGYLLLGIFSLAVIVAVAAASLSLPSLPIGLLSFACVSAYTVSVTVFLSGLRPNILIFSAKNLLAYFSMVAPVMVLCIIASIALPLLLVPVAFAVLPLSFLIARKAFSRWDARGEQPVF